MKCPPIVTTFSSGYLGVFVNSGDGSGYGKVNRRELFPFKKPSTSYPYYSKNSVVLEECYPELVGLKVRNTNTDGWAGSIETSVDGGITYAPMVCTDKCAPTGGATSLIAVDGDASSWSNSAIKVRCLNGKYCTLALANSAN